MQTEAGSSTALSFAAQTTTPLRMTVELLNINDAARLEVSLSWLCPGPAPANRAGICSGAIHIWCEQRWPKTPTIRALRSRSERCQ